MCEKIGNLIKVSLLCSRWGHCVHIMCVCEACHPTSTITIAKPIDWTYAYANTSHKHSLTHSREPESSLFMQLI